MQSGLPFNSRHSSILGTRGMVATSQPLAVAAGLQILAEGGNAADAAVATAAALMIWALATHVDDETLSACFGVMGGFMQPQGHVQVVIGMAEDGLDPQAVLDRPRFCLIEGRPDGEVALEEGIPESTMLALANMGHEVVPVSGYERSIFGRGHVIMQDRSNGVLWGGSDPRRDGCAMTL